MRTTRRTPSTDGPVYRHPVDDDTIAQVVTVNGQYVPALTSPGRGTQVIAGMRPTGSRTLADANLADWARREGFVEVRHA